MFLRNSNQRHYGALVQEYQMDYAKGDDRYPRKIADAIEVMKQVKIRPKTDRQNDNRNNENRDEATGTSFAQTGRGGNSYKGRRNDLRCYCCGSDEYLLPDCPRINSIHPENWYQKTGHMHYQQGERQQQEEDNQSDKNDADTRSSGSNRDAA